MMHGPTQVKIIIQHLEYYSRFTNVACDANTVVKFAKKDDTSSKTS